MYKIIVKAQQTSLEVQLGLLFAETSASSGVVQHDMMRSSLCVLVLFDQKPHEKNCDQHHHEVQEQLLC